MSRYRSKMSPRQSRRSFRRGTRVNRRNGRPSVMRGGIRF